MADNASRWDFNAPEFVDLRTAHDINDGADEWFDRGTNVAITSLQTLERLSESVTPNGRSNPLEAPEVRSGPIATPRVALFRKKSVEDGTPDRKRRCTPSKPYHTSSVRKLRRRHSIASLLLSNARKTIRHRLMANGHTATTVSKTRPKQRVPLSSICHNTSAELGQTEEGKRVDFVASLRRYTPSISSGTKLKSTVPVPFKFDLRTKPSVSRSPFRSLNEQVIAFQNQTPPRFRTQKASDRPKLKAVRRLGTPRLRCVQRNRPVLALNAEQREQLELDEMKKNQFHAKPFNAEIFNDEPKLPAVVKRPGTVCEPFHVRADGRRTATSSEVEVPKVEFVARPVPAGLFKSPKLKSVRILPLTEAQSPALKVKQRAALREMQEKLVNIKTEPEMKEPPLKSLMGVEPFVPILERKVTEVQPFTFEERDKERYKLKEQKINEVFKEERLLREFHAQPMPSTQVTGLPEKVLLPSTAVQPFHLSVDERGILKQNKWIAQMEQQLTKQKEQACFKAQPCTVTNEIPFTVKGTNKPCTVSTNVELQTERRAREREAFEAMLRAKESDVQEARREATAQKEEEERQLIANIRANAVYRAQPIRHYSEVKVESSLRSPTEPITPNLSMGKRKRR